MTTSDLIARRARLLGPNVATFYDDPVHLVRGEGVWLWDADGRKYLDCYNNVAHVGHCHPKVVEAIARQAATAEHPYAVSSRGHPRLCRTADGDSSGMICRQIIMVCSGSEANDIALRMAQAMTGKTGFIATDNTYHGNTTAVAALSTRRPPIGGWPANIRRVPAPDSLTPLGGSLAAQPGAFAANVAAAIADLEASGHGFAGLMLCPIFANEGLPEVGPGFLDDTARAVRAAGGLMLCDEVQPGFGRLGSHWWGHDWLGFAPDVVSLGQADGQRASGRGGGGAAGCDGGVPRGLRVFQYLRRQSGQLRSGNGGAGCDRGGGAGSECGGCVDLCAGPDAGSDAIR